MTFASLVLTSLLWMALPPPLPPDSQLSPPPKPPPAKTDEKDKEKDEGGPDPAYMTLLADDGSPWGIAPELAAKLAAVSEQYAAYAVKFTSVESVRKAKFSDGEAKKETVRRYGYLLDSANDQAVREYRQKMRGDGTITDTAVQDSEAFPPAYAWVFLFSRSNQSYFAYRERGDQFEGYDWVRVFEFKGAVPYTDGREIRQWDGVVLVDAATLTPVEIRAEPSRQRDRLKMLFERWSQSFNIIGFRVGEKPMGFSGRVLFQTRQDNLSFPTQMTYTTFRAVSPKRTEPTEASTREYATYRFFKTETGEKPGSTKPDQKP